MMYPLSNLECRQALRLWMVSLSRQQTQDYFLWYSSICLPLDPEGEGVRLEDRHLVFGYHDVRDAGGREPFQDNKRIRTDKNRKGLDQHSLLCVCVKRRARLP